MDNTVQPGAEIQRDRRRHARRTRRQRRSKRLEKRYNYRGVLRASALVIMVLLTAMLTWNLLESQV